MQGDIATSQVEHQVFHVERNGHHYFRGLDHLPSEVAAEALAAHPDLYRTLPAATGGGVAAVFRTRDRDATEIFQGTVTVTAGGGDMELSSTTINAADAVRINSFTYSASL